MQSCASREILVPQHLVQLRKRDYFGVDKDENRNTVKVKRLVFQDLNLNMFFVLREVGNKRAEMLRFVNTQGFDELFDELSEGGRQNFEDLLVVLKERSLGVMVGHKVVILAGKINRDLLLRIRIF